MIIITITLMIIVRRQNHPDDYRQNHPDDQVALQQQLLQHRLHQKRQNLQKQRLSHGEPLSGSRHRWHIHRLLSSHLYYLYPSPRHPPNLNYNYLSQHPHPHLDPHPSDIFLGALHVRAAASCTFILPPTSFLLAQTFTFRFLWGWGWGWAWRWAWRWAWALSMKMSMITMMIRSMSDVARGMKIS